MTTGKFREPLKRFLRELEDALMDLQGLEDALRGREDAIREREREREKKLDNALYERQRLEDALADALVWIAKETGSVEDAMVEVEDRSAPIRSLRWSRVGSRIWERVAERVNAKHPPMAKE